MNIRDSAFIRFGTCLGCLQICKHSYTTVSCFSRMTNSWLAIPDAFLLVGHSRGLLVPRICFHHTLVFTTVLSKTHSHLECLVSLRSMFQGYALVWSSWFTENCIVSSGMRLHVNRCHMRCVYRGSRLLCAGGRIHYVLSIMQSVSSFIHTGVPHLLHVSISLLRAGSPQFRCTTYVVSLLYLCMEFGRVVA